MQKRFVAIWFRHLITDWFTLRDTSLRNAPLVVCQPVRGRKMIIATNAHAEAQGIFPGMVLADARALFASLQVVDEKPGLTKQLLNRIGEWCIRFSPVVAVDEQDGLILDVTGCSHIWGDDYSYLYAILSRLKDRGYDVRGALADTIGTAWAVARFGKKPFIIPQGQQVIALMPLPPSALRLETDTIDRLQKLGLHQVSQFINMPRIALKRRFGERIVMRLNQALGIEEEIIESIQPVEPYQERLPSIEPIVTATGIHIALEKLLETLCLRLQQENKGLRKAIFSCYRIDGKTEMIEIGTNHPSHNKQHLFKLFENKLENIEPGLGIELFILHASKTEDQPPRQEKLWQGNGGLNDIRLAELLDRLSAKLGTGSVHRYLPAEHYWPERSIKIAVTLEEKPTTAWKVERPRPVQLLKSPQHIEVTAPIPDYPPMLFRHKGKLHTIKKADGPERIEQEWWLQQGEHRDYYAVEDEEGKRYWVFRSGHYTGDKSQQWFLHGFFA